LVKEEYKDVFNVMNVLFMEVFIYDFSR
jgi:hypothetical protein